MERDTYSSIVLMQRNEIQACITTGETMTSGDVGCDTGGQAGVDKRWGTDSALETSAKNNLPMVS